MQICVAIDIGHGSQILFDLEYLDAEAGAATVVDAHNTRCNGLDSVRFNLKL